MASFDERLKKAMECRGETQASLARKINKATGVTIQRQSISCYLAGKSFPDVRRLLQLTMALHVSADYLLGYDVPMDPWSWGDLTDAISEYTGLPPEIVERLHRGLLYDEED